MKERITPLSSQEKMRLERLYSTVRWHTHQSHPLSFTRNSLKKISHFKEMEYRLYLLFHD